MAAVQITSGQFEQMTAGERPVLVNFWAPWCVYCRRIQNAYDEIAERYADRINVVKVNVEKSRALAMQERIEVVPTLVLYRGGEAIGSIVAPESRAMIEAFIGEAMREE